MCNECSACTVSERERPSGAGYLFRSVTDRSPMLVRFGEQVVLTMPEGSERAYGTRMPEEHFKQSRVPSDQPLPGQLQSTECFAYGIANRRGSGNILVYTPSRLIAIPYVIY